MKRIADALANQYEVVLVGTVTRNPLPLEKEKYKQKRLYTLFQSGKLFYLEYNIRLFLFLLFKKVDIVYTVDLDSMPAAIALRFFRKKWKWVYDSHEFFTELPELIERPFVKSLWTKVAKKGIPLTDLRYTVNKQLAEVLSHKYNCSFSSIANMPKMSKSFSTIQEKYILYQGALNVGRGLREITMAMKQLPMIDLYIAGDGPIKKDLVFLVKKEGITNVKFLGMLDQKTLENFTNKAFVGLNLLESNSLNYYYSLANKFFDYTMQCVPSINMNFPCYSAMNQQFRVSVLMDNLEQETLISTVSKLISDENLYMELKNNCHKARLVWNWENEEKRLLLLFHEAFSKSLN